MKNIITAIVVVGIATSSMASLPLGKYECYIDAEKTGISMTYLGTFNIGVSQSINTDNNTVFITHHNVLNKDGVKFTALVNKEVQFQIFEKVEKAKSNIVVHPSVLHKWDVNRVHSRYVAACALVK